MTYPEDNLPRASSVLQPTYIIISTLSDEKPKSKFILKTTKNLKSTMDSRRFPSFPYIIHALESVEIKMVVSYSLIENILDFGGAFAQILTAIISRILTFCRIIDL